MKKMLIFLVVTIGLSSPGYSRDGDLGGGGTLAKYRKAFKLNQSKQKLLMEAGGGFGDSSETFQIWVQSLSPRERGQLMQKVFNFHIEPQLTGPSNVDVFEFDESDNTEFLEFNE